VSDFVALEFESPAGERLSFEWATEALAGVDSQAPQELPLWELAGELDWDEIELVRVLSARLDAERLLAVAALRPAGAEGHGEDLIAGALGGSEDFEQLDETLLSAESGPDGMPRRIGLELWRAEAEMPIRVAGDVTQSADFDGGGVLRTSIALVLRSAGSAGAGALDILRQA